MQIIGWLVITVIAKYESKCYGLKSVVKENFPIYIRWIKKTKAFVLNKANKIIIVSRFNKVGTQPVVLFVNNYYRKEFGLRHNSLVT